MEGKQDLYKSLREEEKKLGKVKRGEHSLYKSIRGKQDFGTIKRRKQDQRKKDLYSAK
jgi:hypothetical protein